MFTVIEHYLENDDSYGVETCICHVQNRDQAEVEKYRIEAIPVLLAEGEKFGYEIKEFTGRCPNCGRDYLFG